MVVVGMSMGAASSIVAAARGKEWIDMVVAESPFASLHDVVLNHVNNWIERKRPRVGTLCDLLSYGTPSLVSAVTSYAQWRANADTEFKWPIDIVHEISPHPLLLIHGTGDPICPFSHAERLYAAAGEPKSFWRHETSAHAIAFFTTSKQLYHSTIHNFIQAHARK